MYYHDYVYQPIALPLNRANGFYNRQPMSSKITVDLFPLKNDFVVALYYVVVGFVLLGLLFSLIAGFTYFILPVSGGFQMLAGRNTMLAI